MKKEYYIIAILAIVIMILATCNKPEVEVKRFTKVITRVDSVRVIDTILSIVSVPIKEVVYIDQIDTNTSNLPLKTFHYGRKDSLLSYNIWINSEIKPFNVKMDYDLTNFTLKDSIFIRDSVHTHDIELPKSYASIGIMMLGSKDNFGFAPMLEYNHKKGSSFKAGFDVINSQYMVGFSKKLSFRKK